MVVAVRTYGATAQQLDVECQQAERAHDVSSSSMSVAGAPLAQSLSANANDERTNLLQTSSQPSAEKQRQLSRQQSRPQPKRSGILKSSKYLTTPANLQAAASTKMTRRNSNLGDDDPYSPHHQEQYNYHQRLLKRFSYFLLFLVCAVYAVAMSQGQDPPGHAPHVHHDHTIPTLLGVRHGGHGGFVNALHSSLYKSMKGASYRNLRRMDLYAFDTYGQSESAGGNDDAGQPRLTVDKGSISFGSALTVSWNGRKGGSHGSTIPLGDKDVIALYCPADVTNPRNFRDAARLSDARRTTLHLMQEYEGGYEIAPDNQWRIGSFPTVREETCEFRLWLRDDHKDKATGEHSYTLAATTGPFFVKHGRTAPTSLHLALGNEPSEMVASFATGAKGTPIVEYGKKKDSLQQSSRGQSSTYKANDLCQAPANITEPGKFLDPGQLHHVTMTNLDPDETYYYRVGIGRTDRKGRATKTIHWSEVNTFVSSPRIGVNPQDEGGEFKPYKFVVYADQGAPGYGAKDGSQRITRWTRREVDEHGIAAVHHFGDLSYANGAGHMWDAWTDMVSTFARRVPLMVGVGNHEYDHTDGGDGRDPSGNSNSDGFQPEWGNFENDSAGECGVPVSRRFKMPSKSGGTGVYWYSFDSGLVHTIMISSEHDLSPGSKQYSWLERDLMSVDRAVTPFLIVESHRPLYNSEDVPANTVVSLAMRDEIEDLMVDYQVDMFLAGHYHAYLRTCGGLYQSKCDNGGPVHLTIGSAGAELDQYPLYDQDWTDAFIQEWGYGRITVHNRTALQFEFVSDDEGKIRDEFWVLKDD